MGRTTTKAPFSPGDQAKVDAPLVPAAGGIASAIILIVVVGAISFTDPRFAVLAGYVCVWVPLVGALAVSSRQFGKKAFARLLRLRVHPLDLLWGLGVGLLARVGTSLIEIWGYGNIGTSGVRLGETSYDGWWLFSALLAPVLLAPVIEELFFRGLILRAVYDRTARRARRAAAPIAIAVSGLTFSLMHLVVLDPSNAAVVLVVGTSTLVFGLAAAGLSVATGRIWAAVIAHITFNALVVLPAL